MSLKYPYILIIWLCVVALSFVSVEQTCASTELSLIEQIKTWESRDRLDLSRKAIEKLFAISPNNGEGLYLLAIIELREGNFDQATLLLNKFEENSLNKSYAKDVRQTIDILQNKRKTLREARLLAKSANTKIDSSLGNLEKSIKIYDELFQGNIPTPQLRYEYFSVLGGASDNHWQEALLGLETLATDYPNSFRYKLAVIEHKLSRDPGNKNLLAELKSFLALQNYKNQASKTWQRAVLRLDDVPASIPYYLDYLKTFPKSSAVIFRMDEVKSRQLELENSLNDPAYITKVNGLKLLEKGQLSKAEKSFKKALSANPQDIDAIGGLGIIRMRKGQHEKALNYFNKALKLAKLNDSDSVSKWLSLIDTATFWSALARADRQIEQGLLKDAEQSVKKALKIENNLDAEAKLAKIYILEGKLEQGRQLYQKCLLKAPYNYNFLSALIDSYLNVNDINGAKSVIDGLNNRQISEGLGEQNDQIMRLFYQQEAELLIKNNKPNLALSSLEKAYKYSKQDPWLLSDLADLYEQQGQNLDKIYDYFKTAEIQNPNSYDTYYAHGLFLNSLGRSDETLALYKSIKGIDEYDKNQIQFNELVIEKDKSDSIKLAKNFPENNLFSGSYMEIQSFLLQAESEELVNKGMYSEAIVKLEQAIKKSSYDPWLLYDLGILYVRQGMPIDKVLSTFAREEKRNPQAYETYYAHGSLLNSVNKSDKTLALYRSIVNINLIKINKEKYKMHKTSTGNNHPIALPANEESDDLGGSYKQIKSYILQEDSEQLIKNGEEEMAIAKLENARFYTPEDPWLLLRLAELYAENDVPDDQILDLFAKAKKQNPDDHTILYTEGLFLQSVNRKDDALTVFREILEEDRDDNLKVTINELVVDRSSYFEIGYDFITRDADDGKSSLDTIQIPMQLNIAANNDGHYFFHAEPVSLDSGNIYFTDRDAIDEFGFGLFCENDCSDYDPNQQDEGVALAIGYEDETWRLDIGTTPLGFEIEDLVGGIKYSGELADYFWGVDLSKRPVTGSILSYAGTKDIKTGIAWGGIRATGVSFSLGHDKGGSFGFWSNLDLHLLTGENVADNSRVRLMAGTYWRLINEDDQQLSVGLSGAIWWHDKNLGEFTFGHGGYYSPNEYQSIGIPIDFYGRFTDRFSYRFRVSASYSWSYEERMPFYPNNPDWQSNAEAIEGITGVSPYYEGGSGNGFGYSFYTALEYKINEHFALGGYFSTDQSDYYKPMQVGLYLRYYFDENLLLVNKPPKPVQAYSDF